MEIVRVCTMYVKCIRVENDLLLKFIDKILHVLLLLSILLVLEVQLLDPPLSFPHILASITQAALFTIQFSLDVFGPGFQFGHHFAAPFDSIGFGLVKTNLELMGSEFKVLSVTLKTWKSESLSDANGMKLE